MGMDKSKKLKKKKSHNDKVKTSVGDAFIQLDRDQAILTDAEQNRRRRTLELERRNNSWGFTLQTYGIRHKKTSEVEVMTYVDYVEIDSSAWFAGLRRGDVILAVDGEGVDHLTHRQLVDRLRKCQHNMRLVVLFEDCHRKVELHDRLIKLKTILKGKMQELKHLEEKEIELLSRVPGWNRLDHMRLSQRSSTSSVESNWDRYSIVFPHQTSTNSSHTNLSLTTSAYSDDTDLLNDSLSMASSSYSEDGNSSMDNSLIASSGQTDNPTSDTGDETDAVFLPNQSRSSVILNPNFHVAGCGENVESDVTEGKKSPGTKGDKPSLPDVVEDRSFNSQSDSFEKQTVDSSFSGSSGCGSQANDSQSELLILSCSGNDSQSGSLEDTLDSSGCGSQETESQSKPLDHANNQSDNSNKSNQSKAVVDGSSADTSEVSRTRSKQRSAKSSIGLECVNESDEITKL